MNDAHPGATARYAYPLPFGADRQDDGRTRFRLWAPGARAVALRIGEDEIPLAADEGGWHAIELACEAGTRYRYRVDTPGGRFLVPDPASRLQAADVEGESVVVDPRAYPWRHAGWRGRPWHEAVIYELHAGLMGGYVGLASRLEALAQAGITAIELMPIADFPGPRNWGYDGALPFAPDTAYGGPDALKALIDRAHGLGLMVFLDVVYNHFGPQGNYLGHYAAPFFREDRHTPWGPAIDFRQRPVREFFIHNALYWLMEYRFDGLRLDAVHAITEDDWITELAARVHAGVEPGRHVHLVLENEKNGAHHLEAGCTAQWNDDAHHVMHVALTGEREGYYADFGDDADPPRCGEGLARWLAQGFVFQGQPSAHRGGRPRGAPSAHLPVTAFVNFLQNHDQIGNRAFGERLTTLAAPAPLRAAMALLLLCPQIPMLFMGEEWGATTPFLYFTSFEGDLARAVREGRRTEFAHFAAFADPAMRARIPDPNDPATYERCRLDPAEARTLAHAEWRVHVRELLALRHREIVPRLPGTRALEARVLGPAAAAGRWRLGDGSALVLIVNLARGPAGVASLEPLPSARLLHESVPGARRAYEAGTLPASCCIALLLEAAT